MADLKAIQQLDLNLLKVFESLFQTHNMTRTAETLHLTPSAVSHAVKRLRQCLDDPLFIRAQNKMVPTPACQRMAPLIIDNLSRLRQILQQWDKFDPATSRQHFTLGLHEALEASILPKLVNQLQRVAPGVTFSSVRVERQQLVRQLSAGHIDLACDIALPISSPVRHTKLFDDKLCVMVRQGHPLTLQLGQTTYFEANHISVSARPSGATMEDLLFQQQGLSRQVVIRCQSYYAAIAMLAASDNLLTLPLSLAKQLCTPATQILPLPFALPAIATHLYWHDQTAQDTAQQWLRKMFTDVFSQVEESALKAKI